jgi:hypothetical protein
MNRVTISIFALAGVLAGVGLAQQEVQMPKPGPEHTRLAYFAGHWTSEGEMKASPFAPAGKFTSTDENEMLPGGFFLVMRSSGTSPMGPIHSLAVMGYNSEEKVYAYDAFSNMGEHEVSKGAIEGATWTWNGESKYQGQVIKGRFVITEVSPTSYTFTYDFSTDGAHWTRVMEGKSTKTM